MPAQRKFTDSNSPAPATERPPQALRKPDADPVNSNRFAADGRPYTSAFRPNPPAMGGTWPGERKAEAGRRMFTGYAPALTRENLDTPDKRRAALAAFVESGYFNNTGDGRPASRLIDLAWRELSGDALTSDERNELAEERSRIKSFNAAGDAQIAEQNAAASAQTAQKAIASVTAHLSILQGALAEAERTIAGASDILATALTKAHAPFDDAFNVGKKVAGAREIATVLREKLIPDAEKALADVQTNREAA